MKKKLKQLTVAALAVSMTFSTVYFSACNVYAEGEMSVQGYALEEENGSYTGLNVDYHSQDEIRQMAKSLNINANMQDGFDENPVNTAPYSPGKVNEATLQNAVNTLNLIRYVAGIPYDVKIAEEYQTMAQAAALLNRVNNELSHFPSKPDDMDEALYLLGYDGASSSNMAMGYGSLYSAINGWMGDEDSFNIDRVGHRRWCLNPSMKYTGFGSDELYYSMYSFDGAFDSSEYNRVAWPAQNTPCELFDGGSGYLPWSVSVGRPLDAASVHVTLTRKSDGKQWDFSEGSSDGDFYVNNDNYGLTGCIIFRPNVEEIGQYRSGDSYSVHITGTDLEILYDVNFFWLDERIGWYKEGNNWYYYNSDREMQYGWIEDNNKWYYMNYDGIMQTGWANVDNRWYYLSGSGARQTGWVKPGSVWYYLGADGVMQTGWLKLNNTWYYLNGSGAMQTGWVNVGGKWYYMNSNGSMYCGWINSKGKWYYLGTGGAMKTGWVKDKGKWYYMDGSGAMQTGWVKDKGKWYYMDGSGAMQTGWVKLNNIWYYLSGSGAMVDSNTVINGRLNRFNSSGAWLGAV